MLSEDEKELIRKGLHALREGIPNFRSRRPQLEMIGTVANTLGVCYEADASNRDGRNIAVIEAGTGTGKTIGYLIPALILAKSCHKRLVVSTTTTTLQNQLLQKDVPALQRFLPIDFTYAVAKGRGRYACIAKLSDKAEEANQETLAFAEERSEKSKPSEAIFTIKLLAQLNKQFHAGEWSGDRDELRMPVPDSVWKELITDRQGCAGNRCPYFAQCPFYAARQRIKEADLVIANHDLVLSALEMAAGTVLPDVAETLFVFDEAHSLPAKVVDHFAAKHTVHGAIEWISDVGETARDVSLGLFLDQQYYRDAQTECGILVGYLEDLYRAIDETKAFEEKRARRFKNGVLPAWGKSIGENILASAKRLQQTLRRLREAMLDKAQSEAHLVQRLLAELGFYLGKLENLVDTWELMLREDAVGATPTARWIEKYEGVSTQQDYLICASPISGGDKLARLLWNQASAVVLTSATLTSCGSFHLFLEQTGLSRMREKKLLKVDSPFDYANKAKLVIPAMKTDPKDASSHTEEVIKRLPALLNTAGTLVLFASARQMREVYAQLPEPLRRIILMQGALPKMEIILRHRSAIDRGEKSVIFGLASFAEGVDLPLEYCTHVVISKLPFSIPDSPLEEARREWIESQGKSAFLEITLPEAGVRLAQGVGRLLRTDQDYGTVTILDKRLITKRWGKRLLAGLPPFTVIQAVDKKSRSVKRGLEGKLSHGNISG